MKSTWAPFGHAYAKHLIALKGIKSCPQVIQLKAQRPYPWHLQLGGTVGAALCALMGGHLNRNQSRDTQKCPSFEHVFLMYLALQFQHQGEKL